MLWLSRHTTIWCPALAIVESEAWLSPVLRPNVLVHACAPTSGVSRRQPSLVFEALSVAATFLEHYHPADAAAFLEIVCSIAGGLSEVRLTP